MTSSQEKCFLCLGYGYNRMDKFECKCKVYYCGEFDCYNDMDKVIACPYCRTTELNWYEELFERLKLIRNPIAIFVTLFIIIVTCIFISYTYGKSDNCSTGKTNKTSYNLYHNMLAGHRVEV